MSNYNCPVHNLKTQSGWRYITVCFVLVLDRCWFSVSHFGRFISGTHWILRQGKQSQYSDSLEAGRLGVRIPVCASISGPVQTDPQAHTSYYTKGTVSFWGKMPGALRRQLIPI
jgi:hypothetical protein